MITCSFGLKDKAKRFPQIRHQIKEAVSAGILVFAAANNDGGHYGRTFPANHGEGVFCIHAATGEGNKASYNPTPLRKEANFMVVGNCLESCWPSKVEANAMRYMSGTSSATPVAVSIAAFMIGFVQQGVPGSSEWTHPPQSCEGMKRIFDLLSEERDLYDWVNFPGIFDQKDGTEILQMIERRLDD